ncbi:MAG: methionine--tRNA ligase [Parcubacteria group bacterium RIFCSPHIGHO2_01_FULL_56_18]|nr:MAG: methionine--tRNA ligase [Parcubacteria group bacterium RIFCSPHIGHO2_01_FULL_56_18]
MGKPFYITTTLPYVNADPHIGFALEIVQADCLARYRALLGDEVFFNTGTDEHGIKIFRKAREEGKEVQAYVDGFADRFRNLKEKLDLFPDLHFVRTTDPHHKAAAQEFWRRCLATGDIYTKSYQVKYCVGCELEKTDSELVDGKCPLHPTLEIELINEENYFFRFSKYQTSLLDLYARRPDLVVPDFRFNEIKSFVAQGLQDFSISRRKDKMPWGVPVPDDDSQVMYVWFDALINYISTLGWPEDETTFEKFWGIIPSPKALQLAGKDNIRQQAAMWQAMLISANLPSTRQILIHGFITSKGQKMSKSLGNVIDPFALVDEYGTDASRLFLLRHIHPFEDSDFTMEKFKESYNADLANGLGNLSARILTLAEANLPVPIVRPESEAFAAEYTDALDRYDYNVACDYVWSLIGQLDKELTDTKPFTVVKTDPEAGKAMIAGMTKRLYTIARLLQPIIPATSDALKAAILANKKPTNLFPRKE